MFDQISEYIKYLSKFISIDKPNMPKFDISAYTDNEYLLAISDINDSFDVIDDLDVTLEYLRGD